MHVNPVELLDIAEGTRAESSAPHLATCEECRVHLRELRAMMTTAKDVEVPEPSPLFWDHLSSRVSTAVAAEGTPRRSWRSARLWRRGVLDPLLVVGAVALLIAIVIPRTRVLAPAPMSPPASMVVVVPPSNAAVADAHRELLSDLTPENDPSLTLVASLTDDVDLETAREAGLASSDSAEHAVTHMSDGELRELRRLLTEELARSGA